MNDMDKRDIQAIAGARDMLRESAKMHRLENMAAHARLCDQFADDLSAVLARNYATPNNTEN